LLIGHAIYYGAPYIGLYGKKAMEEILRITRILGKVFLPASRKSSRKLLPSLSFPASKVPLAPQIKAFYLF